MDYRRIDMKTFPRRDHFEYFRSMENPFLSLTVQVDITDFLHRVKKAGRPFFLCFQYAVVHAAKRVPELRQRIQDDEIIEYSFCQPSYTVALPDGTYRYCLVNADQPLEDYLGEAERKQEEVMAVEHLEEEGDVQSQLFISCMPWLNYSACEMPYPNSRFSNPNFLWGKYRIEKYPAMEDGKIIEKEKTTIPLTVFVHHALVDGRHIAAFYSYLDEELSQMEV